MYLRHICRKIIYCYTWILEHLTQHSNFQTYVIDQRQFPSLITSHKKGKKNLNFLKELNNYFKTKTVFYSHPSETSGVVFILMKEQQAIFYTSWRMPAQIIKAIRSNTKINESSLNESVSRSHDLLKKSSLMGWEKTSFEWQRTKGSPGIGSEK